MLSVFIVSLDLFCLAEKHNTGPLAPYGLMTCRLLCAFCPSPFQICCRLTWTPFCCCHPLPTHALCRPLTVDSSGRGQEVVWGEICLLQLAGGSLDVKSKKRCSLPKLHYGTFAHRSRAFYRCRSANGQHQQQPTLMALVVVPPCEIACLMRLGRILSFVFPDYAKLNYSGQDWFCTLVIGVYCHEMV